MANVEEVLHGLEKTTQISTREDFERWRKRSVSHRKFLLTAYLFGAIPVFMVGLVAVIAGLIINWDQLTSIGPAFVGVVSAFLCAAFCGGPFILIPLWLLLITGLSSYRRVITHLKDNHRVCEVCEAVAMFDDKYVNPSKRKGHTPADLVPQMHVLKENGQTHVLCDACFDKVSAIDSNP